VGKNIIRERNFLSNWGIHKQVQDLLEV